MHRAQLFLKLGQTSRSMSQWPKNGMQHSAIPRCIHTHQIWDSYLKDYRWYAPDMKRDGRPSSPTTQHGPWGPMSWNESLPYKVSMVQVWILSDKWLSKYGLLENFNTKKPIFWIWICTRFWPLAPPPAWPLESDVMEWKLTLQGIYGASMYVFWQVVVKIWTSWKL